MAKNTDVALELMLKPMIGIHGRDSVLLGLAWPLLLLCGLLAGKLCKLYLPIWRHEGPTNNSIWQVDNIGPLHHEGTVMGPTWDRP